jgi:2-alkenal reductase
MGSGRTIGFSPQEWPVNGRFLRFAILVILLLLAAWVAEPYVARLIFAQTSPRLIEARGNLSDAERSIIALF